MTVNEQEDRDKIQPQYLGWMLANSSDTRTTDFESIANHFKTFLERISPNWLFLELISEYLPGSNNPRFQAKQQLDTATTSKWESKNPSYILEELFEVMTAQLDIAQKQYVETKKISDTLSSIREQFNIPQRSRRSKNNHQALKIKSDISKTFSKLGYINSIFLVRIPKGYSITFIHELRDRIKALEDIENLLSQLEDRFPDTYFEPSIFYKDDIDSASMQGTKITFM